MEEVSITIKAIHDVGLPSTFDQDLYRAFLKICDEAEPPPKKWTVNVLKRKNISYEQNEWKTEQTEIQSRIQR